MADTSTGTSGLSPAFVFLPQPLPLGGLGMVQKAVALWAGPVESMSARWGKKVIRVMGSPLGEKFNLGEVNQACWSNRRC